MPPGTYTFTVRQVNASGASVPSNPVTLTFLGACSGAPHAPANFQAFAAGGDQRVRRRRADAAADRRDPVARPMGRTRGPRAARLPAHSDGRPSARDAIV